MHLEHLKHDSYRGLRELRECFNVVIVNFSFFILRFVFDYDAKLQSLYPQLERKYPKAAPLVNLTSLIISLIKIVKVQILGYSTFVVTTERQAIYVLPKGCRNRD